MAPAHARILLVGEDPAGADLLKQSLAQRGYSDVDAAERAAKAFELVRRTDYDLVLLDWGHAHDHGPDVVRSLRAAGVAAPMVVLRAHGSVPDTVETLQAGADDFLSKPFAIDELVARIGALLRRKRAPFTIRSGPITVHVQTLEVLLDGTRLRLTDTESRLLSLLAQRASTVVRRSELLSAIFGINMGGTSNVLEYHVSNLRQKLGPAADLIETVPRVGYRLRREPPR